MDIAGLKALDIFFFLFHSTLIVFILGGWLWRPLRKANLVVIALTAFCWFFLGIWFGFGYCPCTDWHWRVREALGDYNLPFSYIEFLIERPTGLDLPTSAVNIVTVALFSASAVASIFVNARDWRRKRRQTSLRDNQHA